ncbi:Cleavage and polyadenylation specificity factor subunit 2 [Lasallia pustulata]|uniref:Cleavage and polyadenylation specificity factor subunit 2 n=1 Tax=Lasallia pustulata TaxID=136370 RepID=A0A1W5D209_9LECA|nr:Cleavage and polyadenylation specificity factor subunit 2 [Lasallia pustulata]
MFNFTPLLGAQSSSPASQSLLELDGGVKVLIDVGWDEGFDVQKLKALERHIPTLSLVLLTHATPAHIAAFAHCCKNIPLFTQIPVYATTPVISLGRTLLQDIYSSAPLASTIIPASSLSETSYSYSSNNAGLSLEILLQPPTSEEIASYFSRIHPLKYSQPHQPLPSPFSPPLNGLTITAYNAGHTLGGTIWHIQHGMESIVYAVDWNQVRENVLAGAAWLGGSGSSGAEVIEQLRKPTALVCSARGAERVPLAGGRKKRDDLLLDMIRAAVAKGGTVLIPTDTSARVLELAYLLEHEWRKEFSDSAGESPIKTTKLYLASKNVGATMRYARSMLEWMDENVVREFEADSSNINNRQHKRTDSKQNTGRDRHESSPQDSQPSGKSGGPFDFRHVKLLERKSQVDKMLSSDGARVILASDTSLEWGFSKDVLRAIAAHPTSLIILTEDYGNSIREDGDESPGLGHTLWQWYQERRDGVAMEIGADGQNLEQVHTGGRHLEIKTAQRVPLEGKELLIYQQYLATQRQLQNTIQSGNGTGLETSADAIDENSSTSSSSSDESDPERQGKALNISATLGHSNRNKTGAAKEELGVNVLLRQPGLYDYDVRGKKGRETMFPFVSKRRRGDDFGDLIRPEDYLRAEERDEIDGQDMRDAGPRKQTSFGQKRKWEDSGLQTATGRRLSAGINKRRNTGTGQRAGPPVNGLNGVHQSSGGAGEEAAEDSDESDTEGEELLAGPSKVVFETSSIQVSLRIAYVDFAGLHDQRSLFMLIPLIQPRKLIIVGGTASEAATLAEECKQKLLAHITGSVEAASDDVLTPIIGQTVGASMDANAWTVKLTEALVKRFRWQNVRGLSVVTLTGRLAAAVEDRPQADALSRKKQKILKGEAEAMGIDDIPSASAAAPDAVPILDSLPPSMAAATRSVAQPLHVGDLRLADLRRILQSADHTAEFRGEGTLVIDGLVAVRKSGTGKIEVEGGGLTAPESQARYVEGTFHSVKRKIYESLAIIAGG